LLSDQNCDSVKKLTFKESAVSRLTQSRMPRLVENSLIEAAAKKNVADQGAVASASRLPSTLINARSPVTFFWILNGEKAKTDRVRSEKRPMT
jgi:hypothetical protein